MNILTATTMEKCIGCNACSMACSRLVHKQLSWSNAGIRIKSSGGLTTGFEAIICMACKPAACAKACPSGACTERKEGGVRINRSLCIHCGKCSAACPVNAIYFCPHTNTPYVCLHCGQCVSFCPHQCLSFGLKPGTGESQPANDDHSGKESTSLTAPQENTQEAATTAAQAHKGGA